MSSCTLNFYRLAATLKHAIQFLFHFFGFEFPRFGRTRCVERSATCGAYFTGDNARKSERFRRGATVTLLTLKKWSAVAAAAAATCSSFKDNVTVVVAPYSSYSL